MEEIKRLHEQLRNRLENLDTLIAYQKRVEYNEQEIDIRFESLNAQLDKRAERLERRLRKMALKCFDFNGLLSVGDVQLVESAFRRSRWFLKCLKLTGKKQIVKNQVGHFKYYCEYSRVGSVKTVDLRVDEVGQMTTCCNNSQILFPSYMNSTLNVIDMNGQLIKTMHSRELWYPRAVCTNRLNQIFVLNLNNLLVFDEKLNVVNKIENERGERITIDAEEPDVLYICSFYENMIRVVDIATNERIREAEILAPSCITSGFNKLYVSTRASYECETRDNARKVTGLKDESNCITVIDKKTLQLIKVIKNQHWLCPRCIHIDSDENIIVLAFKLNKNREVSGYRWLFVLNLYGETIQEIHLQGVVEFMDALFINKTLVVCGHTDANTEQRNQLCIKFIEIE